ncbi:MAG: hypothetical protein ACLFNW_12280 [Desulfobacterales bacterium]
MNIREAHATPAAAKLRKNDPVIKGFKTLGTEALATIEPFHYLKY